MSLLNLGRVPRDLTSEILSMALAWRYSTASSGSASKGCTELMLLKDRSSHRMVEAKPLVKVLRVEGRLTGSSVKWL